MPHSKARGQTFAVHSRLASDWRLSRTECENRRSDPIRLPIVLWTAAPNEAAQRLFRDLGFRDTMLEMTLELDS